MFLARPAISSVGVDVLGPSRALLVWEGSRLLFGRGVSDVDGDGSDCWRALGRAAAAAVAADGGGYVFYCARSVWSVHLCGGFAARVRRQAQGFRTPQQRRSARGGRLERTGDRKSVV